MEHIVYRMVLFDLLQKPFVFLQITEYILQVSMLCISFENSNKECLTESLFLLRFYGPVNS